MAVVSQCFEPPALAAGGISFSVFTSRNSIQMKIWLVQISRAKGSMFCLVCALIHLKQIPFRASLMARISRLFAPKRVPLNASPLDWTEAIPTGCPRRTTAVFTKSSILKKTTSTPQATVVHPKRICVNRFQLIRS